MHLSQPTPPLRVSARNEFEGEIAPLMSSSTLEYWILLLNALKLHVKLLNFQSQKQNFQKKSSYGGDIPPLSH
jgi:hypothetical protein